ncbi:fibronectin type III domain-containing protein [Tenacibaculum discolor]|uniref:fibronectin type III domain-containing protein n=1 Tax=Tenacibaculum discolor TaxID=361581 RepID=UPI000EB2E59A|nr:fibronectin type III domain-containing protein [Tenacibaculum discolor]RLK02183.1 hypothetical protein C8N27_1316 [Tenacibaculum discolor]
MRKLIFILFIQLILTSCGGGGSEDPVPSEPELGAFELVFPVNNTLCTEGTEVSDTEVSIPLKWSNSTNAISYEVVLTNTESGNRIEKMTNTNSMSVILPKATKFSWNVTAILQNKGKQSNSAWNFYTEGVSVSNHAPFPASITLEDNKDGTINISWEASDLDNDILKYKVYLGESKDSVELIKETESTFIEKQSVDYNTTYFLMVVVLDKNGNSSSIYKEFQFNI